MTRSVKGPSSALSAFLEEKGIRSRANPYSRSRPTPNSTDTITEPPTETPLSSNVAANSLEPNSTNVPVSSEPVEMQVEEQVDVPIKKGKGDPTEPGFKFSNPRVDCLKCGIPLPKVKSWSPYCPSCQKLINTENKRRVKSSKVPKTKPLVESALTNSDQVPRLQDLCLKLVCTFIDCVDSFGDISEKAKDTICKILCKQRKMSDSTLPLFLNDDDCKVLKVYDCSELNADSYALIAQRCPRLETLELHSCGRLDQKTFDRLLAQLSYLKHLSLTGCFLLDSLQTIKVKLESITLSHMTRLSVEDLTLFLKDQKNLKNLSLNHCFLYDSNLTLKLENLNHLDLHTIESISDASWEDILRSNPELRSLWLPRMNPDIIANVGKCCPNLKEIHLVENEDITDATLIKLLYNCDSLTVIDLQRCSKITSESLEYLLNNKPYILKNLTSLNLNSTQISAEILHQVLNLTVNLEHLDISWVYAVQDQTIEYLVSNPRNLKFVIVWGCYQLTEASIKPQYESECQFKLIGCPSETRYLLNKSQ